EHEALWFRQSVDASDPLDSAHFYRINRHTFIRAHLAIPVSVPALAGSADHVGDAFHGSNANPQAGSLNRICDSRRTPLESAQKWSGVEMEDVDRVRCRLGRLCNLRGERRISSIVCAVSDFVSP